MRGRLNEWTWSWVENLNPQAPWVVILDLKCKWQPLPCSVSQRSLPAPVLCSVCTGNWVRGMSVLSAGFQAMLKQESSQYAGHQAGEMGRGEPHVQPREAPSPALQLWDHSWGVISTFGLCSTRKTLTIWSQSSREPPRSWGTWCRRRSWESWACSAKRGKQSSSWNCML